MSPRARIFTAMALGWAVLFGVVAYFRPLMPVDETRYMSVAWEMLVRHDWLLPTLNFDPYSHKPPLLFWLINLSWAVFGVHVWPARVVTFTITAAFVFLTGRLAKRLMPDTPNADLYAMLAMAMMPMFLIYGSVIMFDTLMGVCVLAAMGVLWRMGQNPAHSWRNFAILGAVIGIGILAKGPVALIYMLPPALLAPVWNPGVGRKWYAGILMSVVIGAAIALCWAIPAVIAGGPEYGDKIFVTQSAGRMVNAFDHRRPFWFYFAVLAAYLLPFMAWPTIWRGAKTIAPGITKDRAVRFLMCWVLPVFVFFSAISSKQFHYMTPILPAFAVMVAMIFSRAGFNYARSVAIPMVLMLVPSLVVLVYEAMKWPFMNARLSETGENFGYLHIILSMSVAWWASKKPERVPVALATGAFLLAIMVHVQLGQHFLPRYDLAPIKDAMAPYRERPIAVAPKYDGEYGYALRLTHHVDSIGREDVEDWIAKHPDGVIIARYKKLPENYDILYEQPFRNNETLVIMQRKVMVGSN